MSRKYLTETICFGSIAESMLESVFSEKPNVGSDSFSSFFCVHLIGILVGVFAQQKIRNAYQSFLSNSFSDVHQISFLISNFFVEKNILF